MKLKLIATLVFATLSTEGLASDTEITLGRFFGACEQPSNVVADAIGEACIIQSIIGTFDSANNGVKVTTLPTDWGNYYDQVKASYAGGTPPDVHVMHKHRVPEFASVGILAELTDADLKQYGIDTSDWTDSARNAVSYQGKAFGVPMDFHANLWHLNKDLFEQAGLVDSNGKPMLPTTPSELLAHAKQMKEKTGKDYLAADFAQFPIGVRLVLALLWQQNSNIFDSNEVTVDTQQTRNALKTITDLFGSGYANPQLNYAESQQAFLDGKSAVLVNGTWVVDFYDQQALDTNVALTDYQIASFPKLFDQPATWADSHIWVMPASVKKDAKKYDAAMKALAWIYKHNLDWARTGHMAVRKSVLESSAYQRLPHRNEYVETADIVGDTPPSVKYGAIQDVLNREFQSVWLTGKSVDDALEDAQIDVEDLR
ncbi:extracellular solute-binding protein [Vibrio penaeicida]|uniref:ABC transporter substrate-binding protein n=1 Tax=Vibrio penaeicida TaxID=104609 RepID=A0AAV5NZ74_9VIBR|nr:extracellular solute-binding protein [Vibrio penaeicida]RTZ22857.1 extracellular solute-binding protein [Vibrio penaeicida]GLQ75865.1 ABC transporter substrate-binding protein [Vibrio penaeicida]